MSNRGPTTFDDSDDTFFAGRIGLGYNIEIDEHVFVHINYKEKNLETRSYELYEACEWRGVAPNRPSS